MKPTWCLIGAQVGLALLLTGCAGWSDKPAPSTVGRAVAEPPCDAAKVPRRPAFPADSLGGAEDIFTLGVTLWADRKARRGYELELETVLEGCTRKTPLGAGRRGAPCRAPARTATPAPDRRSPAQNETWRIRPILGRRQKERPSRASPDRAQTFTCACAAPS